MNHASKKSPWKRRRGPAWLALLFLAGASYAQNCLSAADMDASVRKALEATAPRYFEMSARGDTAALRQNSIPLVSANFAGVDAAVKENQAAFTGAQATVRPPFLLTAEGSEPLARAEFLCGVFGKTGQTRDSAVFVLNNLPPGKYGVVILDISGKESRTLTLVLQQVGTEWELAGYYARTSEVAGHDAAWFEQRAREFKAKSENHNAWLYYREAIALSSPVDFMSTLVTDKLYDEGHATQPSDMPSNGSEVDLSAGGKTHRWTEIFPLAVGNDLDVVVKYASPDISNTQKTFQENMAVIKALVAKFPELRNAFAGVVARAVDPSGQDYGSMLPMKEIK
ncbi:MAG: hypothetical protein WA172_12850 [Terriglobales bacterium]